MKILLIGATGRSGRHLLKMSLQEGHEVTAYVRNEQKLRDQLGNDTYGSLRVMLGDVLDQAMVEQCCRGQDVVINAAGYSSDGEPFVTLVSAIAQAVEKGLGPGGRFWFFGGAAALDVPGTDRMTLDLPKIPTMFRVHKRNYLNVQATFLDWSMLCPGPMTGSENGRPHEGLRVSADVWPVERPAVTRLLPDIATSLAFKLKIPELTIAYEDAARVILDNLSRESPLVRKRVGIALPMGMKRTKDIRDLAG